MGLALYEALFDFSTPLFYISLVIIMLNFPIWGILIHEMKCHENNPSSILIFAAYLILLVLQIAVYIQSLNQFPIFDCGFYFSILIPTILFYMSLLFFFFCLVKLFYHASFDINFLSDFMKSAFILSIFLLSIAMAYTSPSGILLCILFLISNGIQSRMVGKKSDSTSAKDRVKQE